MPAPVSTADFLDMVRKSGVADEKRLSAHLHKLRSAGEFPTDASKLAGILVRDGLLTGFQAENILAGRWRRFTIGKYKVLERIGSGGMGQVFLCEHKLMRRRVAVKVLPTAKAEDESARERFYREARAVAALDHPNIVHAYDIDQDDKLHFLVMEYVDGANLQDIVKKRGQMDIARACHYIRQSALGLEHANQNGLVHRDIKPGNILIDRTGCVKVLDMGLARFFNDEDDVLTKKFDENVLGTADYLAPEQAIDSHTVDVRADIYSLGATFYFLLTGKTPFGEGTVAQKLIAHASKQPRLIAEFRQGVPAELEAIILKMMAKQPADRFQTPGEVAAALEPFTREPIAPPPESEMPTLSPAATGYIASEPATSISKPATSGSSASRPTVPPPAPPAPALSVPGASVPASSAPAPPPSSLPASSAPVLPPAPAKSPPSAPRGPAAPPFQSPAPPASSPAGPGRARPTGSFPAPARQSSGPSSGDTVLPHAVAVDHQEEAAPWDSILTDTAEMSARSDTAPRSILLQKEKAAHVRERRRLWIVVAAISVPFVLTILILLWIFVLAQPESTGPIVRGPLSVTKDAGKAFQFRTIRAALVSAQPGDVIQLEDEVHAENLVIDHQVDVTLQAAPGKTVVWKSASTKDNDPILHLSKAQGFKLKGDRITLDGTLPAGRVRDLIFITFQCPGLAIEDVQLKDFADYGIHIMNVAGDDKRPVRIANVSGASSKALAGIYLDASPKVMNGPPYNDFIEITGNCTFQGVPADAAVKMKDNTVVGTHYKPPGK